MWGSILTEVSYLQNFNMGFSNTKSDILIHLTQWQYWWWFWFTFLWVLYYLLVARVFRYRTLKFNPRIASTLRPHGKWGDFLTCLIPITWCVNILINSNFILKLIEWQSESSLFTLRVRAKQWYWIYKLDLRNISDVYSAPRSVGRNKWQSSTFGDLQTAEDYLHMMQMRAYNTWAKDYWTEVRKKFKKRKKWHIPSPVECYKSEFLKNFELTSIANISEKKNFFKIEKKTDFSFYKSNFSKFNENYLFKTNNFLFSKKLVRSLKKIELPLKENIETGWKDFIYIKKFNEKFFEKTNISFFFEDFKKFFLKSRSVSIAEEKEVILTKRELREREEYNDAIKRILRGEQHKFYLVPDVYAPWNPIKTFCKQYYETYEINAGFETAFKLKKIKFGQKPLNYTIPSDLLKYSKRYIGKYKNIESIIDLEKTKFIKKYNKGVTMILTEKTPLYSSGFKQKTFSETMDDEKAYYDNIKNAPYKKYVKRDEAYTKLFEMEQLSNSNIFDFPKSKEDFLFKKFNKKSKHLNHAKKSNFKDYLKDTVLGNPLDIVKVIRRPDYDEQTRIIRMNFGKIAPLRIIKQPYSDIYFSKSTDLELFRFRFNRKQSTLGEKPIRPTVYLTFKQKRYTIKNSIGTKPFTQNDRNYSTNPFLKNKNIIEENLNNSTRQYKIVKKAKNRAENFNVKNWNRLLRSRRVLVLPAHVNITVITNSFDIVHSWHIPGLGLKMDCLPGRATHHTLYIDNVGFYYGQCAEICGRYHHHMPIRVCALPFEHFLVWWHTFGLPKFLFLEDEKKANFNLNTYLNRKFSW